jgi:hypothetical protein
MSAFALSLLLLLFARLPGEMTHVATPPETGLHVLEHYSGTWDCQFTIESATAGEEARTFNGVVEGKWVVEDRFMEQTGTYLPDGSTDRFVIRTMMTFAEAENSFHYTYFMSTGQVSTSTGRWNDAAKTMTSTMSDGENNNSTTIVADFSTPGVERWRIEIRKDDGTLVAEVTGTNTRRQD